ncbi:MAG: glycosyltransferase family 4 protein [Candidatus Omnitrophota bacterium]
MNIALVSYRFPPDKGGGGIGSYSSKLARALTKRGHRVHVVCHTNPEDGPEQDLVDEGVYVHRVREPAWTKNFPPLKVLAYRWRVREKVFEIDNSLCSPVPQYTGSPEKAFTGARGHGGTGAPTCTKRSRGGRLDIVEVPNWIFEGLFLMWGKRPFPVVCRLHTPLLEHFFQCGNKLNLAFRVLGWLEKIAVSRADALVTSSGFYADRMAKFYGVKREKISVVPLGVEIGRIDNCSNEISLIASRSSIFDKTVSILFIGRLEKRKGIEYLLKAVPDVLERCPQARFIFAGKDEAGIHKSYFDKLSGGRFHDSVEFLGCVSDERLEDLYRTCEVLCVPSVSESFGLVFVEAMSRGKPVVACDVCAVGEVIAHGQNGLLVPPRDSKSIVSALVELINDPVKRRRMGESGRRMCEEKFSDSAMAERTERFYQMVSEDGNLF